ncbi:carboxylating nicotinate-nucleotide diphosphorylase [Candidatus Uabimicrobium sp. HlEnr_7]|uniref:carboxylating nicotinate-nucleotide diphosphorylase n=1 Tax=Candidatus Uabimicrobium helgolandensis TaxID=3095367 RepID=UPI0035565B6D
MTVITENIIDLIKAALEEDLAEGDLTTDAILGSDHHPTTAEILFKQNGLLAGMPVFTQVFHTLDPQVKVISLFDEGQCVDKGTVVAKISGSMSTLLKCERTALNFLQRLSGIATSTHEYIEAAKPHHLGILDTRKTTPLLRHLEKYAVKIAGGTNYRSGLYDMVMIKDNHIKAAGSIINAIEKIINKYGKKYFITVEVANLQQLQDIISYPINRIMLDNMNNENICKAIDLIRSGNAQTEIEVSGGITPQRVKELAPLDVDYVSCGAVTNRAVSLDISMNFIK